MTREDIVGLAGEYVLSAEGNRFPQGEKLSGNRIFYPPIFAFGDAEDPYFLRLKEPSVVGKHLLLPEEWLPGAKTVISFFMPFTKEVRCSNREDREWPSFGWIYGRVEGQAFIAELCRYLLGALEKDGQPSVVPLLDPRFFSRTGSKSSSSNADNPAADGLAFTSNWSERHAAFICGLGTFGLSKGLITKKGIAGRFGSIITGLQLPTDKREYTAVYEYCSHCGACVHNCPAKAISLENGKNHAICSAYVSLTTKKFAPRYGCGKCQTGVPCESGIPPRKKEHETGGEDLV